MMLFTSRPRAFAIRALIGVLATSLVVAAALPARAAGGQRGIVSGTVLDTAKQPVAGAKIVLTAPSGRYSALTNARGTFSILGVDVATYTVVVHKDGFGDLSITGVTPVGDQIVDVGKLVLSPA